MLTNNAYTLMLALLNKADNIKLTNSKGEKETYNISSSFFSNSSNYPALDSIMIGSNFISGTNTPNSYGLYLGTGDTVPSVADYKLSGEPIKGVSSPDAKVAMNQNDNYLEFQATLSVKNNNSNSVTVKEIALFGRLYTNGNIYAVMLDRIVLPTPITIAAGETKDITYNLRLPYSGT